MESLLVIGIFCLLGVGPHIVTGVCNTQTVGEEFQVCLTQLFKLADLSAGQVNAQELRNYCQNSSESELSCAENLVQECRESSADVKRVFDKVIDINAVRGGVRIMCSQTDVLEEKEQCTAQYEVQSNACIAQADAEHSAEENRIQAEALGKDREWIENELYKALCGYFGKMEVCIRPYGENCGKEVADTFDALLSAVKPPVCSGVITYTVNLSIWLCSVILAIFINNQNKY